MGTGSYRRAVWLAIVGLLALWFVLRMVLGYGHLADILLILVLLCYGGILIDRYRIPAGRDGHFHGE